MRRGYVNLAYVYAILGDTRRCRQWRRKAGDAAERFGLTDGMLWARAHSIEDRFLLGQWDEALDAANAFITEMEDSAHYLVTVCLRVRASVRLGRGNHIGALADAAAAVEFARGAKHPANLLVALPFLARSLLDAGRTADATAAVTETLAAADGHENILEPIDTAIAMWQLDRCDEYLAVASNSTIPSTRWRIGRAIVSGDLPAAADMLARLEHRSTEAYVRLIGADHLAAHGRLDEAQRHIRRAEAFYQSVNAAAYVYRTERGRAAIGSPSGGRTGSA
jgi:hypothetical protein